MSAIIGFMCFTPLSSPCSFRSSFIIIIQILLSYFFQQFFYILFGFTHHLLQILRRRATDWTVLAFGGTVDAPTDLPGGTVQVLDADALAADGTLREAYGAVDGTVVVIRPDGYVWSRTSRIGAEVSA